MKKHITIFFLAGAVVLAACGKRDEIKTLSREGQAPVSFVNQTDSDMNAAIQKAKESLDSFIAELKQPRDRQFLIKVAIPNAKGNREHIWVEDVAYSEGVFKGVLSNEPLDIPGKHMLDPIEVPREDVSDWMIVDGEKTTGAFTAEVLERREAKP